MRDALIPRSSNRDARGGAESAVATARDAPALRGRQRELDAVSRLFHEASAGRGAALVLRGEAGIGKTALIADALRNVSGVQVLRTAGAEFEMELPFAALHQLCAPVLDRAPALPPRQRAALEAAFGMRGEAPPDRLLVGLAVLGLLSECGEREPVICVIDDAQWLDEASAHAVAFAARRIESEQVAILFSIRDTNGAPELDGFPDLWLEGLGDEDARLLLASEIHAPMDHRVRDRIVAEARGNPLALLELPRSAGPLEVAGGFAVPEMPPTARRIEDSFVQRMSELPDETQLLLVVAAAEPLGDPTLLWDAAHRMGIASQAAAPAEAAGLFEVGQRVRFRHPLVRSAVYRAAPPEDRRRAHRALAEATDPACDPDRRAWHRAQAALGPDEHIAAELERSASRAQARGGLAAAASLTERAAELTGDAARRAARMLAAAQIAQSAGAVDSSLRLLTIAESGPLDDEQRGSAKLQRAQVAFQTARDDKAAAMLLAAADALDGDRSRDAYLEAFAAAMYVGRFSPGGLLEVAKAARKRPTPEPPRPLDLLLNGLCANVALGYEAGVPTMRRAVAALCAEDGIRTEDLRWLGLACTVAMDLRDDGAHAVLAERLVQMARTTGALAALPTGLNYRAGVHLLAGELTQATALAGEAYAIAAATGSADLVYADLAVSAWRGDERRVGELIAHGPDDANRQEGRTLLAIEYATAVLHNGLANYQTALDATKTAEPYDELGFNAFMPPELVESAARLGRPDLAALAIERLRDRARVCNTDWAIGMELRSRALLSDGPDTDDLYREAITRLTRTTMAILVARTQLVYGEWLRRTRRRTDAREQLRGAYEAFATMGAKAFARRAARELRATGEHPRPRRGDALDTLTVQELNIARHAASGATSKEIAATLFLSPRTIDAHLRSIFRKTGATSRRQLRDLPLPPSTS